MDKLKPLPIGIQTFRSIIEGNFLYVDKTRQIYEIASQAQGVYFLARPRRFGKSLLISTLDELFQGNRHYFEGLWIDDSDYGWEEYPTIRLDMSSASANSTDLLSHRLKRLLYENAQRYEIELDDDDIIVQIRQLVIELSKHNKVVILIDEYEKPILDHIDDLPRAREIQSALKEFYTVIKSLDAYLRFVFITGISRFSRVGIFSGMNNLQDISMEPEFSTLLGMTGDELRGVLSPYVTNFAEAQEVSVQTAYEQLQHYYNGFCFSERCGRVYNPFSLLLALKQRRFGRYWFSSGTPTFLMKLIKAQRRTPIDLAKSVVPLLGFETYDIEHLEILPLLFQTGYLTLTNYDAKTDLYTLEFPNYEVESAFNYHLLNVFTPLTLVTGGAALAELVQALEAGALEQFFDTLNPFFADIPYDIQIGKERYYQSVFFLIFKLIGLSIEVEVRTNKGRIDAVVETETYIYLFEFKLDGSAEEALQQIRDKGYAEKYTGRDKQVWGIGVNFSMKERGIGAWIADAIMSAWTSSNHCQ